VDGLAVDERPVALLVGEAVTQRMRDTPQSMRDSGLKWSDLVRCA
jgi:hypothetical protein